MRRYTINVKGQEYAIDVQELAADRFRVLVDGQPFDVTLAGGEDLAEALISPALAAPAVSSLSAVGSTAAPRAEPASPSGSRPEPSGAPSPRPDGGRGLVTAPMPGLILALGVARGERVAHGQALLTLEAMKMQNAIKSPRAGIVAEVLVQPGQSVRHGQPLLRLEEDAP